MRADLLIPTRPDRRIRIMLSSLRSLRYESWSIESTPCFLCRATGWITRDSHPYSLRWRELDANADRDPCGLCDGSGRFRCKTVHEISRPSSAYLVIARWTDPKTMITHSRLWTSKARKSGRKNYGLGERQGTRPSCGNRGMHARLYRTDWSFDGRPITCPDCLAYAEAAMLRRAGCALPPRTDQDDSPPGLPGTSV